MSLRARIRPAGLAFALAAALAATSAVRAQPPPASTPPPPVLGESGRLRAAFARPGEEITFWRQQVLRIAKPARGARWPGFYDLGAAAPEGRLFALIPLVSFEAKRRGMLHGYRMGLWPQETREGSENHYVRPAGFIEVTKANVAQRVSTRFRLGEFVTHDQADVWPKYVVLRTALLDKLELVGDALLAAGRSDSLRVMSGFRTPAYNQKGVVPNGGRVSDSRHIYGDAADIFVDADGDSLMDDLDRDGQITVEDARWLAALVESVEVAHPALAGGVGAYPAAEDHGPFVHTDVRGHTARW